MYLYTTDWYDNMSLETQDIGQIIETVMFITSISKYGNATVVWREYLVNLGYKRQKKSLIV